MNNSYLVFNTKGGCGKSLISREVIAGPLASEFVVVEIDPLNKTQQSYQDKFKDVVEISSDNIEDVLIPLNEHDNVVIDVGVDNLSETVEKLVDYHVFEDINCLVVPLMPGRTDEENALNTYKVLSELCKKVVFVFNRHDNRQSLTAQYPVFFKNIEKVAPGFNVRDHAFIPESDLFAEAQNERILIAEMAVDKGYKKTALELKAEGDTEGFKAMMKKELQYRSAGLLMEKSIMPAHDKITG